MSTEQRKPNRIERQAKGLLTMAEAAEVAARLAKDAGLDSSPQADTLKHAAAKGALEVAKIGNIYVTDEKAVTTYLKNFDPKNRTRARPVKDKTSAARSKRYRERLKAKAKAKEVEDANERPSE